jgi:cyclase
MKPFNHALLTLFIFLFAHLSLAVDTVKTKVRTMTQLAEGVYEIRHPDAPDSFPNSNTTVIIGDRGVFVVDSCLLPSQAKLDIEQIKKWTSKPVTHLLNTHWHFDHTMGNATYQAAFPNVQIIAHEATLKTIANFNQGAVDRYPQREQRFRKIVESGKNPDGSALTEQDKKDYEEAITGLQSVVGEFKGAKQVNPNVSFTRELDVDLGNRMINIRWLGRGNTAGDTVVYLPKEKILMTGDLVVSPVPYMFGGFPTDFVPTLEKLMEIDAQTIVPGHGDVMKDFTYAKKVHDMMRDTNQLIEQAVNEGKTLEEVQKAAPEWQESKEWRARFAEGDPENGPNFDGTFRALVTAAYNQLRMR